MGILWVGEIMPFKSKKTKFIINRIITHIVLIFFGLMIAIPFLWMISTSLKPISEVWIFPPKWIPSKIMWKNYYDAFTKAPFLRYILNTLFVATAVVIAQFFFTTLAAYAFSVLQFKGRDVLFFIILATLMIPYQMTFVPAYVILAKLKWLDTYLALIVPFFTSAFGIFLIRQSFKQVPRDLLDAAIIDGAGHLRRIWNVMIPLSYPTIITFSLFSFVYHYNDYFWPLIVTSSESVRTVPLGLARFLQKQGGYAQEWPVIMAANTIAIIPLVIVFLITQRYYIQGVATTGLKG
jgi:ABC-type glycerol-3-phosphate transport system permease component